MSEKIKLWLCHIFFCVVVLLVAFFTYRIVTHDTLQSSLFFVLFLAMSLFGSSATAFIIGRYGE